MRGAYCQTTLNVRSRFSWRRLLAASFLAVAVPDAAAAETAVDLVRDGAPRAVLVLPAEPAAAEQEAAAELADWIERMSGARLPLAAAGEQLPAGLLPVLIGAAAPEQMLEAIRAKGTDPESFILRVRSGGVYIRGLERPEGTRHGAYELLEQLGVRWFGSGEFYTVAPRAATLTLTLQETIQVPSFTMRQVAFLYRSEDFLKRNRVPGVTRPIGRHGFAALDRYRNERPELFGKVRGETDWRVYNFAHPEAAAIVAAHARAYFHENPDAGVYSVGTHDHPRMCGRAENLALDGGDWDPFHGIPSQTDRLVWFLNQVAGQLEDEFGDRKIAFYIYGNKMRPPVRWEPHRMLAPTIAPITLCRWHGPNNPHCPDKSYKETALGFWRERGHEIIHRGYWFNLAGMGLPYPMITRLRREIPWSQEMGIYGFRVEFPGDWSDVPGHYLAAKLMWNHEADVDALVADFSEKFYGPAAEAMLAYHRLLDGAVADADYHTGSNWDHPNVFHDEIRDRARRLLGHALDAVEAELAAHEAFPDDPTQHAWEKNDLAMHGKRVGMAVDVMDYLEAFCRMMDSRHRHQWRASYEALGELERMREKLEAYDPPAIMHRGGQRASRFTALFGLPTRQGYVRTSAGNEFVAGLTDRWEFFLDPGRIGEDIGLHRAETAGGNWREILTSMSWSNQGLHHYKGEAWYRQEVHLPVAAEGRRLFIWFAGVDDQARVWVNGQLLGNSHGSPLRPFEMDATEAVRAGAKNLVTVRVSNARLNEIGTGGLLGPVFFYAPAAGADAELDNIRPLAEDFPLYELERLEQYIP